MAGQSDKEETAHLLSAEYRAKCWGPEARVVCGFAKLTCHNHSSRGQQGVGSGVGAEHLGKLREQESSGGLQRSWH